MDVKTEKQTIREKIWKLMEIRGISKFPLPCYGRIPNFIGAEKAAKNLTQLEEWKMAKVIKVNPDSPQRMVRELGLRDGKTLVMATPQLKKGFLILKYLKNLAREASTIKGAFKYGKPISLKDLPKIDLIVEGSVAVAKNGARLGKGHGYGEIEFGILKELGLINNKTPIVTTVHEIQIVEQIPLEKHDVPIDLIVTPKRIIRTNSPFPKPKGIYWELIDKKILGEIPLLKELFLFKEKNY